MSMQEKYFVLYNWKRIIGRTALLLQGGAVVSLAHIGVVKELVLQNLLPKVIIGTASGALVAAIVGTSTTESLLSNLENINLKAFETVADKKDKAGSGPRLSTWFTTMRRRLHRYQETGHPFDIEIIGQCIRDNIGDQTFEEAHKRTGRILNITIAIPNTVGTPQLLNHMTAPQVLIWSAAAAALATSKQLYPKVTILCRKLDGTVGPYFAADASGRVPPQYSDRSPLTRIGELFTVNHFIVSQTRPYIIPFVRLQQWADQYFFLRTIVKLAIGEMLYWLRIANISGLVPTFIQRIMLDEQLPTSERWSKVVISPSLQLSDIWGLFDLPSQDSVRSWTLRGQRAVWPFVNEILMRTKTEYDVYEAFTNFVESKDFPQYES